MKGHVAVINTMLSKGENVDAITNVRKNILLSDNMFILYIPKNLIYFSPIKRSSLTHLEHSYIKKNLTQNIPQNYEK